MSATVVCPRDLPGALRSLEGASQETQIIAGGTDLMVEFESGRTRPGEVIDLWAVDELRGISQTRDGLRLGALTTCAELLREPLAARHADILVDAAREVGAVQIQNRATLGGNLGTASPAADMNPVLLALDAKVRLLSLSASRELPAAEFLTGYRSNARRPDELIESVIIPPRPPGERRAFRKVGTRRAQAISKVVLAVAVVVRNGIVTALRASAGSVAERTVLCPTLASELVGQAPSADNISRAAAASAHADVRPVDDVRSTEEYRRQVYFRVLKSALEELLS